MLNGSTVHNNAADVVYVCAKALFRGSTGKEFTSMARMLSTLGTTAKASPILGTLRHWLSAVTVDLSLLSLK